MLTSGPRDRGSIPGRVIPQTFKKWYLIPPCLTLSIIKYISRVKWSNSVKGVESSPTSRCSGYWKGSLRVALDYSRQLICLSLSIYIYIYIPRIPKKTQHILWHYKFLSTIRSLRTASSDGYIYIYIYIYPTFPPIWPPFSRLLFSTSYQLILHRFISSKA